MKSKTKKVLIILAIVLVVAVGIGVYFGLKEFQSSSGSGILDGFFPSEETNNGQKPGTTSTSSVDDKEPSLTQYIEQQKQKLFALTTESIIDYWVASSTAIGDTATSSILAASVFYINEKGDILQVKETGKASPVVSSSFGKPLWLKQNVFGSRIVVKFESGKFVLFDVKNKSWREMEDGVTAVDFSPDGQRIAFLKENQSQTSVYIQDLAKAKQPVTLVVSLTAVDFNLLWIETGSLALTPKPSYFVNGQAWLIDLSSRSLRWLGGGSGYSLVFSSPFNFGLEFSSSARTETKIGLIDKSGKSLAELFFSTVADKCSFSLEKEAAFCAVPYFANKSSGLVLPDDFLKRIVYFKDKIYRLDLKSSAVDIIFDLEDNPFDVVDIKHRSDQLFFVNRYDDRLYLYNLR